MIKLEVKIEEKSNSYPIFIDCNLSNLKSEIFDFIKTPIGGLTSLPTREVWIEITNCSKC